MLKRSTAENVFSAAMGNGADFVEIYMEETNKNAIGMVNGRIETAQSSVDYGLGIRLFINSKAFIPIPTTLQKRTLCAWRRKLRQG